MPSSYVIRDQTLAGRYVGASEVVRDGLRALEDRVALCAVKLEAICTETQRSLQSGVGVGARTATAAAR